MEPEVTGVHSLGPSGAISSTEVGHPPGRVVDSFRRIANVLRRQKRRYASFFEWPDRRVKEKGVASDWLASLAAGGDRRLSNVRPSTADWPDCEVDDALGRAIAIEITEFVDREALERNIRGEAIYRLWEASNIISFLEEIIRGKDLKCSHGGLFHRVVLVIHADEPELRVEDFRAVLAGRVFCASNIDEAYLLLSYDPRHEIYPHIRLSLEQQ